MTDLEETPAVPPFDSPGDERAGLLAAGALLVVLGWFFGVVLNVALHLLAPAGGHWLGPVFLGPTFGAYAEAVLGLGLFTGAFGAVLVGLGARSAKAPLLLPGYQY